MKLLLFIIVLLAVYAVARPIPDANCAGSPNAPLSASITDALSPPVYYKGPNGNPYNLEWDPFNTNNIRNANYGQQLRSGVDSANVYLSFTASHRYARLKVNMISPTDTPIPNEYASTQLGRTYPCDGWFGFPTNQVPSNFNQGAQRWSQVDSNFCPNYYTWWTSCYQSIAPGCCNDCDYTPYIVFKHDTFTALGNCFNRTEDVNHYYYDTIVQTTYSVNRPQIRNQPVLRSVLAQAKLRFRFRRFLSVDTAQYRSIFVGGLRQVYADIITLNFLAREQLVYFEIFTSVQWPYQLYLNIYRSVPNTVVDNGIAQYNPLMTYSVVNDSMFLIPNTTSGRNCGVVYNAVCEQVWGLFVRYPQLNPEATDTDFCQIKPTLSLFWDVGCQELYEGNCTVGAETSKSDWSFGALPLNDFCVDIVQDVDLTAQIYPYVNFANAAPVTPNVGAAVYSYVYGGPVYYRVVMTAVNRNTGGTVDTTRPAPSISSTTMISLFIRSGAGANIQLNITSGANGFQKYESFPTSNSLVFAFLLNENTVVLANFDENQLVDVAVVIRVNFNNIQSKSFDLQNDFEMQALAGQDSTISSQFFVATDSSSAAASSSMNVVAVAAGSAAGIVALTIVVAFLIHRRSMKSFIKQQSQPPTSKELEEANEHTSSSV
jgi:hypothetical protein